MSVPQFKSTWHRMRELVIISLNIIYVKDLMQHCERMKTKTEYLNISTGPIKVLEKDLEYRKRSLNKRMKILLEDLLNSKRDQSEYVFNIDVDHACLTKKQLEKGYALFTNVHDKTFALDIRKGALYPIEFPESNTQERTILFLEYTAKHEGAVYEFFEIDITDPLKNNELRY